MMLINSQSLDFKFYFSFFFSSCLFSFAYLPCPLPSCLIKIKKIKVTMHPFGILLLPSVQKPPAFSLLIFSCPARHHVDGYHAHDAPVTLRACLISSDLGYVKFRIFHSMETWERFPSKQTQYLYQTENAACISFPYLSNWHI